MNSKNQVKWLDSFTKTLLGIMLVILIFIFISGKYMDMHKMEASGTDDKVNSMASGKHHPFIELPGDSEVGAFSVVNFFAGIIIGHHWEKLFGKSKEENVQEKA
ncbi:hypothetical protein [Clostridium felsineum]|uniref:Uncharacterized protein n=1 Tax=Clostridium felsineum TaxID=36839 RepID=A0A1S8LQ07_9CLOT|nr:hypothetical protein [Clostridium felsineum]URZ06181.1 hypothetical protein CLROS_015140 [Clostridium felsineum]URZ11216.1 hypothetical protein CROST_019330 [Clostridium felsineum]